jgi:chaperonin GroEL (HSP60 family)
MILRSKKKKPSWDIMGHALRAPFELLLSNCGEDAAVVGTIMNKFFNGKRSLPKRVFDAERHKVVEPFTRGIIEPTKVCRVSIGNALSVASLLITLGGLVVSPRNAELEQQIEMQENSMKSMMEMVGG